MHPVFFADALLCSKESAPVALDTFHHTADLVRSESSHFHVQRRQLCLGHARRLATERDTHLAAGNLAAAASSSIQVQMYVRMARLHHHWVVRLTRGCTSRTGIRRLQDRR